MIDWAVAFGYLISAIGGIGSLYYIVQIIRRELNA